MKTPTLEQSDLILRQFAPASCTKVVAYAGTGKTSTLAAYAETHITDDILYLAFNKSAATDAGKRFPINCTIKTVHGLAYGAVGHRYKDIVGGLKSYQIAKALHMQLYKASITRVALENWLNSAEKEPTNIHLPQDELNLLNPGWEHDVIAGVERLFVEMKAKTLSMTHNGYLKAFHLSTPVIPQETILLDEAQDTNPVTLAILVDQIKHDKKLILVGDPYQQIYSWRGAINAMDKIQCETLRLTRSFRFGQNICDVANNLLRRLLNEPVPVQGTEQNGNLHPRNVIICRTNAGMFAEAIQLCRNNQCFVVTGEQRFFQLIDEVQDIFCLQSRRKSQIKNKYLSFYTDYQELCEKAKLTLDYELQSKIQIVENYGSDIPEHCRRIRSSISSDPAYDVTIVTGHQSKGLEWDKVRLAPDFPSLQKPDGTTKTVVDKADKNDEENLSREEANLLYVSCTRAKKTLDAGHSVSRFLNEKQELEQAKL